MKKICSTPRILILSQRNIFPYDAWRSPHYEFEDLICRLDSVELLTPHRKRWFRVGDKMAREVTWLSPISLNLCIPRTKATNEYDMFFMLCSYPSDLLAFNPGNHWKDRCKTSICMIDEAWVKQIPREKCYLKILSKFDHVVLYYSQSVKAIGELTGKETYFMPPGIDAIKFCPYPELPNKAIDVYSVGRRSSATHQKLLEMVKTRSLFYVYDSISGSRVYNSKEHRSLVANIAKRSRVYLVNPGLFDRPEIRGNQIEIGNRYFEGAAAGCILVGEIPRNDAYGDLFNWPDAVLALPFGSDQIDKILDELAQQPGREKEMRKQNVINSLRRHDWVFRWESILRIAGLDPTPGMRERKEQLERLAILAEGQTANSL